MADLLVQLGDQGVLVLHLAAPFAGEQLRGAVEQLPLPLPDLRGMDAKSRSQFAVVRSPRTAANAASAFNAASIRRRFAAMPFSQNWTNPTRDRLKVVVQFVGPYIAPHQQAFSTYFILDFVPFRFLSTSSYVRAMKGSHRWSRSDSSSLADTRAELSSSQVSRLAINQTRKPRAMEDGPAYDHDDFRCRRQSRWFL